MKKYYNYIFSTESIYNRYRKNTGSLNKTYYQIRNKSSKILRITQLAVPFCQIAKLVNRQIKLFFLAKTC